MLTDKAGIQGTEYTQGKTGFTNNECGVKLAPSLGPEKISVVGSNDV